MLSFALGILVKATLVLSLGALAERLWHKRAAELRHAVLAICLFGALLVPIMSALLPAWQAPIPWVPTSILAVTLDLHAPDPVSAAGATGTAALESASARVVSPQVGQALGNGASMSPPIVLAGALLWTGGALVVLVLLLNGQVGMARMRRHARRAKGERWRDVVRRAATDLGLRSNVSVLLSPEIEIPLTYGILRPVVLLPLCADSWSDDRKRLVLVHELAHLRRRDASVELVAWLACALYWFHPLVWHVVRRARLQRELACDDLVVRVTGDSIAYARQLVEIAAAARISSARPVAALAMAARGSLEERVRALLDRRRARGAASLRARVLLGCPATGLISLLATLRPVAAESRGLSNARLGAPDTLEWRIAPDSAVEWRGPVRAGDTVTIRAAMGSIVVDSGAAGEVTLAARRSVGPRGVAADTRVNVFRSSRTLVICSAHFSGARRIAPCEVNDDWGRGSVDDNDVSFHVSVPAGVHLVLMTGLGDLTTMRVRGDVRALTGNGDASIQSAGAADVEAYTGRIRMHVLSSGRAAPLALRVKHGGIDVMLPPNEGAAVDAAVDSGTVFVEGVARPSRTNAQSFVGVIGAGRRPLRATLIKGVINIGIAPR